MKKIIEEAVPENINIFDIITKLAEENKCWIFISNRLYNRLQSGYKYCDLPSEKIFYLDSTLKNEIHVENVIKTWTQVTSVVKQDKYITCNDPKIIYFLY